MYLETLVTEYSEVEGFMTLQPDYYVGDDMSVDSTLIPPAPGEPTGWMRGPKDWGDFGLPGAQIPLTFVMFILSVGIMVMIGVALTAYTRSLAVTFMVLGFLLGILCFWPKGGYLDWWTLFPYVLVGWALLHRQSENPIAE